MGEHNMYRIRRAARQEAWYSDSYNPFRKTMRSNTWAPKARSADVEAGTGVDDEPLSAVATEPMRGTRPFDRDDDVRSDARTEKDDLASGSGSGRPSDPDSEETVVSRQATRTSTKEEKARRRFMSKFSRNKKEKSDESEDPEKKRPWYKGKVLKHKPFTTRNQIQATVFNSWINIFILAAPVGIGLFYAGVNGAIVFAVNFIAIIPLAAMLSFATEEIALHVGESLGGLLNATFG